MVGRGALLRSAPRNRPEATRPERGGECRLQTTAGWEARDVSSVPRSRNGAADVTRFDSRSLLNGEGVQPPG
jgi:hypothetical protein